jgi:hypothetical protein
MTVEIGTEFALFPEKEYINGIFVAVLAGYSKSTEQIMQTEQAQNTFGGGSV